MDEDDGPWEIDGQVPPPWQWSASPSSERTRHDDDPHGDRPRSGYDQDKCRNVLVRYCAHIPRNYQYRDGIQKVFLILRDHLGDENLDLAGGVLYELIEVDCPYSDDPGAAFQRWRHDHMNRHNDFDLPHIPHMTTITSVIQPTARLVHWRQAHPDRYPTRLSDHAPPARRLSSPDHGCIRSRKTWMIEHTMYVSSRHAGTRPCRSVDAKEYHEILWNIRVGQQGRLVEERVVLPPALGRAKSQQISPRAWGDKPSFHKRCTSLKEWSKKRFSTDNTNRSSSSSNNNTMSSNGKNSNNNNDNNNNTVAAATATNANRTSRPDTKRTSWFFGIDSALSFREFVDARPVPLPSGCRVPNGIFARKFGLVPAEQPLPPTLLLDSMPTAESKAAAVISQSALENCPTTFKGPFTPQLGFDGGLDFKSAPSPLLAIPTTGKEWGILPSRRYDQAAQAASGQGPRHPHSKDNASRPQQQHSSRSVGQPPGLPASPITEDFTGRGRYQSAHRHSSDTAAPSSSTGTATNVVTASDTKCHVSTRPFALKHEP